MLGEVNGDIIKEFVIINWFISLHQTDFFWVLNRSEVLVLVQCESSVRSKTTEGFIGNSFLERSELKAALGNHSTVVFDWVHNLAEPVKFSNLLSGDDDASILIDNNLGGCCCLNHYAVMLTWEVNVQLGELLLELLKSCGECGEDEVRWWTPVEDFGGEAVSQLGVVKWVGNVIVLDSS